MQRLPLLPRGPLAALPQHAVLRQRDALPARAGRLPPTARRRGAAMREGAGKPRAREGGVRRAARGVPACGERRDIRRDDEALSRRQGLLRRDVRGLGQPGGAAPGHRMRAPGRGRGADRHRRRGDAHAQRARRQGGGSARHLPLRQGVRLGGRRHRAWPHRSVAALDRRDAGARRREGVRARRRPLEGDEGPAVVRVMDAPTASRPAINPLVADTGTPPIPEAQGWVERYGGAHGPLINMSQAVPGHPPHPDFIARLVEAAASVDAARYGPIAGDADLRAAYAGHLAALSGGDIEAADVAITAGCNMGFVAALMLVAKAGDAVLLPSPWYFNHEMTAAMLGIAARPLPCDPNAGFVPDPDEAGRLIDARTSAIVLVTPTGAIYPGHVIGAFADLCRRRGLWLVVDETY